MYRYFSLLALWTGIVLSLPSPAFATRDDTSTTPINRKVLQITFDPRLSDGKGVISSRGWAPPDASSETIVGWFKDTSDGRVTYTIVDKVTLETFPPLLSGRSYDATTWERCMSDNSHCLKGAGGSWDMADYVAIMRQQRVCERVNSGEITDVWMYGGPYFGFWESNLMGPNAYYYNSSPTTNDLGCKSIVPIMGFSYERGTSEMIHNWGHALESTMTHVYGRLPSFFDRQTSTTSAACGLIHWPPNTSTVEYQYDSRSEVLSTCDDYLTFPNLSATKSTVSCQDWGCTSVGFYTWVFHHIPHYVGTHEGKLNDWWQYVLIPDIAAGNKAGYDQSSGKLTPTPVTVPTTPILTTDPPPVTMSPTSTPSSTSPDGTRLSLPRWMLLLIQWYVSLLSLIQSE